MQRITPGTGSVLDRQMRIPYDLPQMPIGILKVTGVTSPEGILRRLHEQGARALRLRHQCIDFGHGRDVMPEGEFGGACAAQGQAGIMGNARARPDRQL